MTDTANATSGLSEQVCYHHFALLYDDQQLKQKLSDVLFVLVAGSSSRVEAHAKYLEEQEELFKRKEWKLERLTQTKGSRFDLFKLGPVLLANHGIGYGSISIVLHELFLMCRASDRLDKITLIRFGTCGGIGVDPGTVCITDKVFDSVFRSYIDWPVCGRLIRRESVIDSWTSKILVKLGKELESQTGHAQDDRHNKWNALDQQQQQQQQGGFRVVAGATLSTNDFYEEQGRTNGAICDHTIEDKMDFLKRAQQIGIINIEMEANLLAAMCHKLKVKHGISCVALTNRLVNDKITVSHDVIGEFETRLFRLNGKFIEYIVGNNQVS